MKKILTILFILSIFIPIVNAENENNGILYYDQCSKYIEKNNVIPGDNYVKDIQDLGTNLCVFIADENDNLIILSKNANDLFINLLDEKYLDFLNTKYYRGEKININFSGEFTKEMNDMSFVINNKKYDSYFSLKSDYSINFFEDTQIEELKYLKEKCSFKSYIANCNNKNYETLIKKVDSIISDNFLDKDKILELPIAKINEEKKKVKIIISKIIDLEKNYQGKENILFTIEYIIYKLKIYNNILENSLGDLTFRDFLTENKIYFVDKRLIGGLFISQSDKFTYFYYNNIKINTLKNDVSHFDEDVVENDKRLNSDLTYLKEKILDKFTAKYVEATDNKLALITKKYKSKKKYLIFDFGRINLLEIPGEIEKIELGRKGYFMILKDYNGNNHIILYNKKEVITLVNNYEGYNIDDFELLEGNKININYSNDDGDSGVYEVDVSEY